jgi:hypothetical protein
MIDEIINEPLIYTSKGNLPISSLKYSYKWGDYVDCVIFSEIYELGEEVVKKSCHVYVKQGVSAAVEQTEI